MKPISLFAFSLAVCAGVVAGVAHAQQSVVPPAAEGSTVVYLSETATQKVAQDRVRAMLEINFVGEDAAKAQARVNKAMAEALDMAQKDKNLTVFTGAYHVYPEWNAEKKQNDTWRASQNITFHSTKADSVLNLATKLQAMGFTTTTLQYYLDEETERQFRDSLMTQAIRQIEERAQKVAKQLNLPQVHLAEVRLEGNTYSRAPRMEMMAFAKAGDAAPAVAAGQEEEISLSVNATVYLSK